MSRCCVPLCKRTRRRNKDLSFFTFPRGDQGKKWLQVLKLNSNVPMENLKVCSMHFTNNNMYMAGSIRKLRKNAIPCLHINIRQGDGENNVVAISDEEAKPNGLNGYAQTIQTQGIQGSSTSNESNNLIRLQFQSNEKVLILLNDLRINYTQDIGEKEEFKEELKDVKEAHEQLKVEKDIYLAGSLQRLRNHAKPVRFLADNVLNDSHVIETTLIHQNDSEMESFDINVEHDPLNLDNEQDFLTKVLQENRELKKQLEIQKREIEKFKKLVKINRSVSSENDYLRSEIAKLKLFIRTLEKGNIS